MEWMQAIQDAMLVRSLVVLHGNVNDLFLSGDPAHRDPASPNRPPFHDLDSLLGLELERRACSVVLFASPTGVLTLREPMVREAERLFSWGLSPRTRSSVGPLRWPCGAEFINPESCLSAVLGLPSEAAASVGLVIRGVARAGDPRSQGAITLFQALASRHQANLANPHPSARTFVIFDREASVPFELGQATGLSRMCHVPLPSLQARRDLLTALRLRFQSGGGDGPSSKEIEQASVRFDGFSVRDMLGLVELSRETRLGLGETDLPKLYNRFTTSERTNAWEAVDIDTIRRSSEILSARVIGQNEAVECVVAKLIQARSGAANLMGSGRRPRGVFFFAGPTGVGKTELAKEIAKLIFADVGALVVFDMSEYSEEHAVARLIGAPPGYIGHSEGGQLIHRMVERPFSVVLFDEIEKAHSRLLDKFLQILEEGRLTDGQGRAASFAESLIIFTSNLGVAPPQTRPCPRCAVDIKRAASLCPSCGSEVPAVENEAPAATDESAASRKQERARRCTQAVRHFFVSQISRPEILNRIGEHNIVAFNDLREPADRERLVCHMLDRCARECEAEFGVQMRFDDGFRTLLCWHPDGIARNGGRGVRNLIERFILSRFASDVLFPPDGVKRSRVVVTAGVPFDEVSALIAARKHDECEPRLQWE